MTSLSFFAPTQRYRPSMDRMTPKGMIRRWWWCYWTVCHGMVAPRPVRRVAIVGAGISGLSVAHALVNSPRQTAASNLIETVDIFDARPSLDTTAGAGIQLNGGLAVLGRINPTLQTAVYQAGLPQGRVQSKSAAWFQPTGGLDTLLELDLLKTVQSAGGQVADALLSSTSDIQQQPKLWWISIMRGALQQVLYDMLPTNERRVRVQFGKKLTALGLDEDSYQGVRCTFADGTETGPYDVIIGCEGINSVVKNYVDSNGSPDTAAPSTTSGTTTPKSAIYSGLRIRYAVADDSIDSAKPPFTTLTQFFGRGAYALHGVYGTGADRPPTQCTFIVYLDDEYIGPFPKPQSSSVSSLPAESSVTSPTSSLRDVVGENADWSQDRRQAATAARTQMLRQLEQCGIPQDNVLGHTIQRADRFFELGSYFHNPFCAWSTRVRGSHRRSDSGTTGSPALVVLCGDAAHALPPFLGQGSNQAIQDAYCLVEKIFDYNNRVQSGDDAADLQSLFKDYEAIRWPACFNVFWKAAFLGYLETGGPNGIYANFRDAFFKTMGLIGVASRVLLNAATPKVE
jgi:salicylate hydroxylase